MNALHDPALHGFSEHTGILLQRGSRDINQADPATGYTPLMYAARKGHSHVAAILLGNGASVSIEGGQGITALHLSALFGYSRIARMLLKAGADTEARLGDDGFTALHLATSRGHSDVVKVLIEAGASIDTPSRSGKTALCGAAMEGHVGVVKLLLAANANPLLSENTPEGSSYLPLDAAAENGQSGVVQELIQYLGVGGCGGPTAGANALCLAAEQQHLDVMTILTRAGVADDDGSALRAAAVLGDGAAAKLLLRHRGGRPAGGVPYVDLCGLEDNRSPLVSCVLGCHPGCPRVLRLLLDAGADSSESVAVLLPSRFVPSFTPLEMATEVLSERGIADGSTTEEQRRFLACTRRVLVLEEAIHAVSWLWSWPADASPDAEGARGVTSAGGPRSRKASPTVRWRRARPGVLVPAMFRYSSQQSDVA